MTQLGNDTFVRANQSGWGTASDGQSWSILTGSATAAIASNEGTLTGSTTQTILTLGSGIYTDAEALVRLANTANADSVNIFLRIVNATNFYRCRILNNALTIQKVVSGSTTTVISTAFSTTAGTFYWIRFRAIGTTLQAKIWATGTAEGNTFQLTATDSSLASGQLGLGCTLNAVGNTASFDSYYAADYVWADATPVTDSGVFSVDTTPGLVDATPVSDKFSASPQFNPVDATPVADSLVGSTAYNPSDSAPVTDTFAASASAQLSDSAPIADSLAASQSYNPVDAAPVADTLTGGTAYNPVDSVPIADSLVAGRSAQFIDSVPISDAFSSSNAYNATDAQSILSSLSVQSAVSFVDLLAILDSFDGHGSRAAAAQYAIAKATFRDGAVVAMFRGG